MCVRVGFFCALSSPVSALSPCLTQSRSRPLAPQPARECGTAMPDAVSSSIGPCRGPWPVTGLSASMSARLAPGNFVPSRPRQTPPCSVPKWGSCIALCLSLSFSTPNKRRARARRGVPPVRHADEVGRGGSGHGQVNDHTLPQRCRPTSIWTGARALPATGNGGDTDNGVAEHGNPKPTYHSEFSSAQ